MMPVSFMEDNRVFDRHGNAYALFVLNTIPYAFLPEYKKIAEITQVEQAVSSQFGEYYVYLLTKQLSLRQLRQEMQALSRSTMWDRQTKITIASLQQRTPFTRINFLAIPLKKRVFLSQGDESWVVFAREYLRNALLGVRDVKDRFYSSDFSLGIDVLESSRRQSEDLLKNLSMFKGLRAATISEVEWWLKKGYFRGLIDPELAIPSPFPARITTKGGQEVFRPIRNSLLTLTDAAIREKMDHLQIHHGSVGVSYQSFYSTMSVPTDIDHRRPTNREWIFGVLERLEFPVDVAFHMKVERHTEAKDKVNRKNKIAKSQVKEWQGGESDDSDEFNQSNVPEELLEDLENVSSLRRKFRQNQQPLLFTTTIFSLGAPSQEELRIRKAKFKEAAEAKEHVLINPPFDMRKMFQAYYPFGPSLPVNWEIPMDPGVFAASVPFGIRMLGDPNGFYLGKLLTGRIVFMNPERPMVELNRTGAVLICGALGSGKTVLLKLIVFQLLALNAYVFANDPKGDWRVFLEHPEVKPISKMISFTPGSDTLFTPFRLAATQDACNEAALGVLELLFNKDMNEYRNLVIKEGLNRLYLNEKGWDMFHFQEIMANIRDHHDNPKYRENAEIIHSQINYLPDHSIGRMVLGRDDGRHLFEGKRFVCAITRGLSFPQKGTSVSLWSDNERYSVGMMYAIITLAVRFLKTLPAHVLKGLAWEEFWFLKYFEAGKKLYNEALRLARSEKTLVAMASQNPTDVKGASEDGDDVTGLFGWKFMLRMESKQQIEYALHHLMEMVEDSPDEWIDRFSRFYKDGIGLVRDPEGRVGELQIEVLDPELFKYLKSTPPKEAQVNQTQIV